MIKSLTAVVALVGVSVGVQVGRAADITIFDNILGNSFGVDARGIFEDQETEPGTVANQRWDLEAFHLTGTKLSLIGGFDFMNSYGGYASGDLFIDVNGDAIWGTPVSTGGTQVKSNVEFKYDYVISFGGRTLDASHNSVDKTLDGTYTVYSLTGASDVTVKYNSNSASNPWIYHGGGTVVTTGNVSQSSYLGGGYLGDTHYQLVGIDLNFLTPDEFGGALLKFTMECGNDNLVGRIPTPTPTPFNGRVPDSGASLTLLGLGVLGLAGFRRKATLQA